MKKVLPILCLLALIGLSNGIAQTVNSGVTKSVSNDVLMTDATPVTPINDGYVVQGSTISISGGFVNQSSEPITNITIKYSDGVNEYSDVRVVNIAPNQNYTFTHNTQYVVPPVGTYPIDVWVEWGDNNMSNKVTRSVKSILFTPLKKVTCEEETGTWCGWCVRGFIYMDSMYNTYPNTTELIAVHNNDPMMCSTYNSGATSFPGFSGFPSLEVDRTVLDDPSNIFYQYSNYINNFGLADINVTSTYNNSTHQATIVANTHFAQSVGSGYKLSCVIVENKVHNTTYTQENYYSGQANSGNYVLPTVDGYNFHALANPVPGNTMYYDFVGRAILGLYTGVAGSLPSTINSGDSPSHTFTYSVPGGYVLGELKAIVFLINSNTSPASIVNANHTTFGLTNVPAISDMVSSLTIYPNPFNNQANINFSLNKDENVTVTVSNLLGQNVMTLNNGLMSEGQHNIIIDGSTLTSGMYFVTIKVGDYSLTQKVLLNK